VREISSSQRPLQTQQTQTQSEIRTRDPSRRAAVKLRLTPRGHWLRQKRHYVMRGTVKITELHQNMFEEEEGCLNLVRS
jgi:hypothetical protein